MNLREWLSFGFMLACFMALCGFLSYKIAYGDDTRKTLDAMEISICTKERADGQGFYVDWKCVKELREGK